jgi:dihydrofolate reductase
MRKLIVMLQLSIDGYMADAKGSTDWMVYGWGPEWTWDNELRDYFIDLTASVDCILLGKNMALEGYSAYWEKMAAMKDKPQSVFAKNVGASQKVIFSKSLKKTEDKHTIIASGELSTEVNRLKAQPGKNMIAYGGATFDNSLVDAGLVDEYQLFINPAIVGKGITPFKQKTGLQLISAKPYSCGVTVLCYGTKV